MGAGQSLTKVLAAHLQQLGRDGVRHLEDLTEDVGQALLTVETEQHGVRASDLDFFHQQRVLNATTGGQTIGKIAPECVPR